MSRIKQSPDRGQLLATCSYLVGLMEKEFGAVGYSLLPWASYSSDMLRYTRDDMLKQLRMSAKDLPSVHLLPKVKRSFEPSFIDRMVR